MRLIGVKLPEYGHYWEGNPAAFLSINLVENEQFEGFYGSSGHDGVEQHHGLQQDVILLLQDFSESLADPWAKGGMVPENKQIHLILQWFIGGYRG